MSPSLEGAGCPTVSGDWRLLWCLSAGFLGAARLPRSEEAAPPAWGRWPRAAGLEWTPGKSPVPRAADPDLDTTRHQRGFEGQEGPMLPSRGLGHLLV